MYQERQRAKNKMTMKKKTENIREEGRQETGFCRTLL